MRINKTVVMFGAVISTSILLASSAQAAVSPDEAANVDETPMVHEFYGASLAPLDEEEAAAVWQLEAEPIVQTLREQFPEDFAVAWIRDRYVEVAFAAATPPDAAPIINGSPIPIKTIEGFGVTEVQMASIGREIHAAALNYVGGGVAITSGPIPDRRVYQVEFAPENDDSRPRDTLDRQAGQLKASLDDAFSTDDLGGFTIEIHIADAGTIGDSSWGQAGGTALNALDSGLSCTSGFVVSARVGPDIGVVTAGHCSNSLRQISSNGNFNFDFRAQHIGTYGDMQWMRSPVMMDAWFHYDHGLGRAQMARGDVSINSTVYVYGRNGGRQSARVTGLNQSLTTNGQTTYGLVRISGSAVQPGDSGGPVYLGNTAYGIIKGYGAFDDFYTPINPLLNQLQIDLCIDPPGCQ